MEYPNMSKITATRIDNDEQRLEILPTFFGADFLRVEMALYSHLQKMCEEYNGAYWYMYKLSNGAMYLAPAIENRKLRLTVDTNGYSGEVSGDAAGLITCLFVFNALCWKYPQRQDYVDLFYKLRDFAFDHPEAEEIIAAID